MRKKHCFIPLISVLFIFGVCLFVNKKEAGEYDAVQQDSTSDEDIILVKEQNDADADSQSELDYKYDVISDGELVLIKEQYIPQK